MESSPEILMQPPPLGMDMDFSMPDMTPMDFDEMLASFSNGTWDMPTGDETGYIPNGTW